MTISSIISLTCIVLFVLGMVAIGLSGLGSAVAILGELLPRSLRSRLQESSDKCSGILDSFGFLALPLSAGGFLLNVGIQGGSTVATLIGAGLLLLGVAFAVGTVRDLRRSRER